MNNKIIFGTYLIILGVFVSVLIALLIIPFACFPSLIFPIWGQDATWSEALRSTLINLLYGLISSALLAVFVSFITYQHDILRMEYNYISNIDDIDFLCQRTAETQNVAPLTDAIELQNRQHSSFTTKAYKRSLVHSPKIHRQIQSSIEAIEVHLTTISDSCQDVLNVEREYNAVRNQYDDYIVKLLDSHYYTIKYGEYKKETIALSDQLCRLQESKRQKIEMIAEPAGKLKDEYNKLALVLGYHSK